MKFILIIIDGLGLRNESEANAFKIAKTPVLDDLIENYPCSRLETSGLAVGLPDGVMGNSEVGHMTIGAGRIVKQDLVRINHSIEKNQFKDIPEFIDLLNYVKSNGVNLHLIGLLSDGGVHSHINHLFSLLSIIRENGIDRVFLHAITDGRDTSPTAGIGYVEETIEKMTFLKTGELATIMGRYYAMDRDRRWDRTQIAFNAMRKGAGKITKDPLKAIRDSYADGITDEFIKPIIIKNGNGKIHSINDDDAFLMFNFRADRMRQITKSLGDADFLEFDHNDLPVFCTTMSSYDDRFPFPVLFPPISLKNIFPEILAQEKYRQLRIAETEKYAHVTYFFNGGEETPFLNEDHILVSSPKVATYDLQPEMSAPEVAKKVLNAIKSDRYDCIIMNFANPDMVGHTGSLNAAITAIETIDQSLAEILNAVKEKGGAIFLTSDHGNLEEMVDSSTGEIHTAHTLNKVPFVVLDPEDNYNLLLEGRLSDIAPTILDYLGIPIPKEMTGNTLLERK